MDLKISIRSQLYALRELSIISAVYIFCMYFLYVKTEFDLFKILFLSTFVFYFLVLLLPVLILHVNYLCNQHKNIKIEYDMLIVDDRIYSGSDIDRINVFASYQHFNDSVGVTALPYNDYYYYLEICLKDGKQINLSSLIDYKIDEIIKKNLQSVNVVEQPSTFLSLLIKKA